MSHRTVTVDLTVRLKLKVEEGVEVDTVVSELDYHFRDTTTQAQVDDTEITDYQIVDSR